MQPSRKSLLAGLAVLTLAAIAGCQRGEDSSQPAAASLNGPTANKDRAGGSTDAASDQDPSHPVIEIVTTLGKITVRLDAEKAPLTVDNFLTYMTNRHYDQTIFHQVLKEYPRVVLAGAYTADLVEKKARTAIRNEAHNGLKNCRGTLAMARRPDNEDTATCHFFFNLTDNEVLDHKDRTAQGYGYCVFGEVFGKEGLDTIDRIGQVPTRDTDKFERLPVETVAIQSMRRIR